MTPIATLRETTISNLPVKESRDVCCANAVCRKTPASRSNSREEGILSEFVTSERLFAGDSLILTELSHRISNEFASAISTVSLAAARSDNGEVKAALAVVIDRLHNYASVHRALQMPTHNTETDASAHLRQLCRSISRSKLDDKGIRLVFVERRLWMRSDQCWRLGLIVFELITNAVRHGFDRVGGVIHVELLPSDSLVECRVADNGCGTSGARPGRGLKIVETLAEALGGRIEHFSGAEGTMAVLIFPRCAQAGTTPLSYLSAVAHQTGCEAVLWAED
jgi:two-component sensor histidine kinase